jgi:hypothetical protein
VHQRLELKFYSQVSDCKHTLQPQFYSPVSLADKLYLVVLRSEVSPVPLDELAGLAIPVVNADFLGDKDDEARSYTKVSRKHKLDDHVTHMQI